MGLIVSLAIFFSAIIVHEFSHALVANKLGDPTAQKMGRLTLNPLAHIDPFGTILLPLMLIMLNSPVLFGWAKPVPINFNNLKNPKRDIIWVGIAGPCANLLMATAGAFLLKIGFNNPGSMAPLIQYLIIVNVVLAVFNLIPIPPLDGSRVLMGLLPRQAAIRLALFEPYGFILLFALLYLGLFDKVVWPVTAFLLRALSQI